jgi:hypothetical protein
VPIARKAAAVEPEEEYKKVTRWLAPLFLVALVALVVALFALR